MKLEISEIFRLFKKETSLEGFIEKVSIDSRDVDEKTLFVAIKGERFDGNDFVTEVLNKGVKAVVCSRKDLCCDERVFYAEDTVKALLDIARVYREKFNIPFVALTGSVGKTTTKGMIHAVLCVRLNTLKTIGNLNNEIGVPKTLFRLDDSYEAAVIEMGMNHKGEISRISQAVKPDVGVITNVGTAHIENLGTREGILKAKSEILDGMKKGSTLIINADNDMLSSAEFPGYKVFRFGIDGDALDIKAENIKTENGGMRFVAVCGNEKEEIFVPAVGVHNVYNALAALSVGKTFGFSLKESGEGLKSFAPEGMRQNIKEVNGYTFIEDCYNANPDSMRASLTTLNSIKKTRSIAVLGDMMELGDYSKEAHTEVGAVAASLNTDVLFTFGEYSRFTSLEGEKRGIETVKHFESKGELKEYLKSVLKPSDTVLFKGSRSVGTEDIFNALYEEWGV